MTGKKESDWRQKQPELDKSGTNLRKARLSARFWASSAITTTSLGQSNPKKNYPLRCVVAQPRAHPAETEEVIRVNRVLRITELISFIGIHGVISVARFIRTLSDIRAGLRKADRVLVGILWSSGL